MQIDFKKFKGILPYSSELFGVYQPLLCWKSKIKKDRFEADKKAVEGHSPYYFVRVAVAKLFLVLFGGF